MRALAAMALSICTGCLTLIGGDRDHDDVGDDDGDIDAGGGFVLHLPYPPGVELVALKIGDEPWQQVTSEADVAIDTRYAFAYVCPTTVPAGFPPAHRVVVQFLMPYERQAPNPCAPPPSVQLQTVTVGAGTATIDVFAGNMHGRPDANLLVAAPVGIWDVGVVASRFNGANRTLLSIHRDVDLRANTMVVADFTRPSLDLELVTTPFFDFGDSPPDPVRYVTSRMVLDDQTWVELGSYEVGTSPPPHVPALSQIGAGDRVIIEGSAYASGGERRRAYQRRIISENPGTYVLPAHLGGMATATETSWEGDWDFVTFAASYESQATGPTMYVTGLELTISKAAGAGNSIPHFDPRTLPGWNVAWAPPPTWVGGEVRAWRGDPLGEMWSAATAVSSPL